MIPYRAIAAERVRQGAERVRMPNSRLRSARVGQHTAYDRAEDRRHRRRAAGMRMMSESCAVAALDGRHRPHVEHGRVGSRRCRVLNGLRDRRQRAGDADHRVIAIGARTRRRLPASRACTRLVTKRRRAWCRAYRPPRRSRCTTGSSGVDGSACPGPRRLSSPSRRTPRRCVRRSRHPRAARPCARMSCPPGSGCPSRGSSLR